MLLGEHETTPIRRGTYGARTHFAVDAVFCLRLLRQCYRQPVYKHPQADVHSCRVASATLLHSFGPLQSQRLGPDCCVKASVAWIGREAPYPGQPIDHECVCISSKCRELKTKHIWLMVKGSRALPDVSSATLADICCNGAHESKLRVASFPLACRRANRSRSLQVDEF